MTMPALPQASCKTGSRHRLLLVDDEPNVAAALARLLRKEPYALTMAASGAEALETMARQPFDLIIADYDMPGMKGTELLREVAQAYPDTVRFMLTGRPSLDVAIQAINEGAISRFFTKPADDFDLLVSIRQALQHRALMVEAFRLLKLYKAQQAVLESLERESPGITQLHRDSTGAIDLGDFHPGDYDRLIEELRNA
jgi:DNA-binding NtrC family response regulator